MKSIFTLVVCAALAVGCSSSSGNTGSNETENPGSEVVAEDVPKYQLVFRQIDNRAKAYVNDSLIYDSQNMAGAIELEIDLSEMVSEGNAKLTVELYNGKEPYNQLDSYWEIVYDIFIDGELIEFVRESGNDGQVGKVFSETHYLDELW